MRWALLDVLSDNERRTVLAAARRRRFGRDEVIFHEGDPGDTMHLLDKGRVAVRVTTPMGGTATLRVLGPGSYFGELAVLEPAPRNATITTLEAVETLGLHRDAIDELRQQHPSIDRLLLGVAVAEVRRLSSQLLDALYVPVAKRVPRRLMELAELYPSVDGDVVIPLKQEDLADLCGTTRPTTNHVLLDLQGKGAITLARRKVTINDPAALARLGR